jgi:8-oxo-dGTP diphosphatase
MYARVMPEAKWSPPSVLLAVDLVILTLRAGKLQVLLIERGVDPFRGALALPGGFLYDRTESIPQAAQRELFEEAGLQIETVHLESLALYGDPDRDPRGRVVSAAHLVIAPGLPDPQAGTDAAAAGWLPAYDVLNGETPLAFDHRTIVADGVERARSKLEYSSLATAFCAPVFTIAELQAVYEAVWNVHLDPRNFYRKIQKTADFIVPAGPPRNTGIGRPARVFRAGPQTVLNPAMLRPAENLSPKGQNL